MSELAMWFVDNGVVFVSDDYDPAECPDMAWVDGELCPMFDSPVDATLFAQENNDVVIVNVE